MTGTNKGTQSEPQGPQEENKWACQLVTVRTPHEQVIPSRVVLSEQCSSKDKAQK